MRRSRLWWMGIGLLMLCVWCGPVAAACLEGTSVAAYQYSGPYGAFYLYTIELHFTLPRGLSNVSLKVNVSECPELACQQFFLFPDPAGEMIGENAECAVPFYGEYNCLGNPSIGLDEPVVKWDAGTAYGCEPGQVGSVRLYFLSNVAPDPNSEMAFMLIKNGQNVCEGVIYGDLPGPACMVPTQGDTWGSIKAIYE